MMQLFLTKIAESEFSADIDSEVYQIKRECFQKVVFSVVHRCFGPPFRSKSPSLLNNVTFFSKCLRLVKGSENTKYLRFATKKREDV